MDGPEPVTQNPMQVVEEVRALIAAGQNGQAARVCEQNLASHPQNATACLLQGLLLKINGRPNDAITAYDKALAFAPEALPAYMEIAEILADKGWLHSAVIVMETARDTTSFSAEAQAQLTALQDRLEHMTRAARGVSR